MKKWKRAAAALVLICTAASLCLPAAARTEKTVRIGISECPGYAYRTESGALAGADVEYAYQIAQYANLHVSIRLIPDAADYFQELDQGRVDLLFDAVKTPAREQKYLYAEREIGSTPYSVYVRQTDDRYEYGNVNQLKTLTVGAENGGYVAKIYTDWCRQHGFTPSIRYFPGREALDSAINSGRVAAGLFESDTKQGYRTIQVFSPTPYYIIFRKENTQLKSQVDDAMTRILSEDPLYESKLIQKYASVMQYDLTAFSNAEKAYLRDHRTVRVAVLKNDEPYYAVSRSGKRRGFLPSYYAKLSKLTGLRFTYTAYNNQKAAIAAVRSGKADVLGLYSDGLLAAYPAGLRLTRQYGMVDAVMVTPAGTEASAVKTVAVKSRGKSAVRTGMETAKKIKYLECANTEDSFQAMRSHRADAMICGLPSATWLLNQNNSAAYNLSTLPSVHLNLCGAVAYDNPLLCSILDKAIHTSSYSFNELITKSTMPENTWRTVISRIPASWILTYAAVTVALVLGLVLAMISLKRRQRERAAVFAEKAETDRQKIQLEAMEKNAEEKNRFFSNISHDMRTPLNAVIGFSRLTAAEDLPPRAREYVEKVQSSGQLLLDLIDDTLTISKANSGKLELHPGPVSFDRILTTVTVPVQESAEKKHVRFTADAEQVRNRVVLADGLGLQKILLNLLTNAVKYTPEGGSVAFAVRPEAEDWVRISVKDSGIGISPEFLPHIYEPFAQERQTGYESTGTGLGLSIVKQLVDLMGGEIAVESQKDQGTTFTVRLRLPEAAPSRAAGRTAGGESLAGKTVLVCEDNTLNREIACTLLRSWGVAPVEAENGQQGVERFAASAPGAFAAVLMDLRMPVLDGLGAARAIRALKRPDAADVPILAMTADAFEEDVQRCLDAGMDGHLAKPFAPEELYQMLSVCIGGGEIKP